MELAQRRAQWTSAADRLFAVGTADDEVYVEVVQLVGQAVAHLRERCPTVEDLLTLGPEDVAAVDRLIAEARPRTPMNPQVVLDAACSVRYAEIIFLTGQPD